jgi:hypothetical protein
MTVCFMIPSDGMFYYTTWRYDLWYQHDGMFYYNTQEMN